MAAAKRFYEQASIAPVQGGFGIELDGKPVRTPLGQALVLPMRILAEAVAAEWQAQGDSIDPASMPLCGYANTAIDRVGKERQVIIDTVMHFAQTDLLCYHAEEPADLVSRQQQQWQPVLDWAAETLAIDLKVTSGVLPLAQPQQSMQALNDHLEKLDDMTLTALASLAAAAGSIILALAVYENHIDAARAFEMSRLDETFQSERWGSDAQSEAQALKLKNDMDSAVLFLSLLRQ